MKLNAYSIYDQTGTFCKVQVLPESSPPPENSVAGHFCNMRHYFDIGQQRVVQLPLPPTPHHTFNYTTKQWIDPRTAETQWVVVRTERNKLLVGSDWTQMPDAPDANKSAWSDYRQALRDITTQADPFNIVWPVAPA